VSVDRGDARAPGRAARPALGELMDETVLLFHRLRAVAEEVHGQGEASAGRRGVLRSLARGGPQTVPQLARARPVSRQHIQSLVNALAADGLVELVANPAHKRSPLVRLTAAGARRIEAMAARERTLLGVLRIGVTQAELRSAAETLRRVRGAFAGRAWRESLAPAAGRPRARTEG